MRSSLPGNLSYVSKHRRNLTRLDPISIKDHLGNKNPLLENSYDSLVSLDNSFLTQGNNTPQ